MCHGPQESRLERERRLRARRALTAIRRICRCRYSPGARRRRLRGTRSRSQPAGLGLIVQAGVFLCSSRRTPWIQPSAACSGTSQRSSTAKHPGLEGCSEDALHGVASTQLGRGRPGPAEYRTAKSCHASRWSIGATLARSRATRTGTILVTDDQSGEQRSSATGVGIPQREPATINRYEQYVVGDVVGKPW